MRAWKKTLLWFYISCTYTQIKNPCRKTFLLPRYIFFEVLHQEERFKDARRQESYLQASSELYSSFPNPTRFKAVQKWHFDLVCSQGGPDCASSAFRGSHALDGQPAQKAAARSQLENFLSASRCTSFRKRMGSVDGWRWPAVPRGWMESTGTAQSQRSHLQREVLSSKKNCWEVWEGILTTATPRKKPLSLINYSRPAAPARQPDMRLPCKTSLQMQSRCSSHCQGRHL